MNLHDVVRLRLSRRKANNSHLWHAHGDQLRIPLEEADHPEWQLHLATSRCSNSGLSLFSGLIRTGHGSTCLLLQAVNEMSQVV